LPVKLKERLRITSAATKTTLATV